MVRGQRRVHSFTIQRSHVLHIVLEATMPPPRQHAGRKRTAAPPRSRWGIQAGSGRHVRSYSREARL